MPKDTLSKIEVRDDIEIEWDAPITMDDGLILRADIFKPKHPGVYPVLISYGPYGKGAAFQEAYAETWKTLINNHADRLPPSSHQ